MVPRSIRLRKKFSVPRLLKDLEAVSTFCFSPHNGPYHNGGWELLSLIAPSGRLDWDVYDHGKKKPSSTPALARTPYMKKILTELGAPILSARLMALKPGGRIRTHRDPDIHYSAGLVRLHLPIVSNPRVKFILAGKRQRWKPGELWYGDFSRPHSVHNAGALTRIHLVIDLVLTPSLRKLFPAALSKELARESLILAGKLPCS